MSKIETIKIKNFKGIDRIESDLHSSNVYVVGGNGKGKTSFIDAVWCALTGKNVPTEPIKQGENESTIEIELEKHVAILDFKRQRDQTKIKTSFKLISKEDGESIEQPRTVLNQLIGVIDFNPNHFFELSANKQVEYFCSLIGLDFGTIDRDVAELFEQRSFMNKELKRLKDDSNVWFDPTIADREPVNVKQLFEMKIEHDKKRQTFEKVLTGVADRENKLIDLRSQIEKLEKEVTDGKVWLNNTDNQPISEMEYKTIQSQIDTAESENQLIATNKSAKINSEKLKKVENEIAETERKMDEKKKSKRDQLSESIDIPDLSFDGEKFLFKGLPFENTQINTANQLIAGLRIGLKLLKGVRILKFDGSLIDNDNMKLINDWSAENDVQLFVEQVDRSGGKLEIRINESTDGKDSDK